MLLLQLEFLLALCPLTFQSWTFVIKLHSLCILCFVKTSFCDLTTILVIVMHMSTKYLGFFFFHSNNLRLEIKTSWIDKSLVQYENHSVFIICTARTCLWNWCIKWFIWRAFYSNFLGYKDLFMKKVDKAIYENIQFWFLDYYHTLKSVKIVV